jgi:hypothetical protein
MTIETTGSRRIGAHGVAGLLAVILAGIGCGGGSNGSTGAAGGSGDTGGMAGNSAAGTTGAGGAIANTPVGQCTELVSTLCDRFNQCEPPDGGLDAATTACNNDYNVAVGCARATSTAFAGCINDVNKLSCSELGLGPDAGFQEPLSCNTPLNISPSDAQNKCSSIAELLCDPTDACNGTPFPTTDANFIACANQAYFDIGCAFAVSESATYTQCLNDLCTQAGGTADGGTPDGGQASLPASCNNVIVGPM